MIDDECQKSHTSFFVSNDVSIVLDFFCKADIFLNLSFNFEVSSNFLIAFVIVFPLQSSSNGDSSKRSDNS